MIWADAASTSHDDAVLRGVANAFQADGGLKVLDGNLGRAVVKTSAVKPEHRVVEAPAAVFHSQEDLQAAFRAGELDRDVVAVVCYQGPRANGMPELHKLTPALGVLQDRGFKVALVTDGRMSGASGKVLAAIHVTPEASDSGAIARVRDGDVVRVDATSGELAALVDEDEWASRQTVVADLSGNAFGLGRELFAFMRAAVSPADVGASVL